MPAREFEDREASALQVAVAEFQALRQEIGTRSSAQHALINLDIVAIGTIGSFVLSRQVDPLLLLVLPVIAPALGMLYFDHANNIDLIGRYIGSELKPLVRSLSGSSDLLAYEDRIREFERTRNPRGLSLGLPLFVLFAGAPILALVRTWPSLHTTWPIVLWGAGVTFELIFLAHWGYFVFHPHRKQAARDSEQGARKD